MNMAFLRIDGDIQRKGERLLLMAWISPAIK
jgi:hypothetical protein